MGKATENSENAALEEIWAKYQADALEIPERVIIRLCRSRKCRAFVWDGLTAKNRRDCAFDVRPDDTPTGCSHWRTCADRERFTKPRRP